VNERSLVLDYELQAGSSDAFVTVVAPIARENLSSYERFNMILEWPGRLDQHRRGALRRAPANLQRRPPGKRESRRGKGHQRPRVFSITPKGGTQTRIGSDKDGDSNGRLDSEDLNGNNFLERIVTETGVIIPWTGPA